MFIMLMSINILFMKNNNLKVGDVVYLNLPPDVKLTAPSIEETKVKVAYFSTERQSFESTEFFIDTVKLYNPKEALLNCVAPRVSGR